MQVLELAQIAAGEVLRILESDHVRSLELSIADQIPPILRLDVESLDRVVGEDVAGVLQSNDMRVVCEDLERDRIDILALLVLGEVELGQLAAFQRRTGDWVRAMLLQPRQDVGQVERRPIGGADGMLKRLEGDGAEVEGQALEGGAGAVGLASVRAGGGAEGIFAAPF